MLTSTARAEGQGQCDGLISLMCSGTVYFTNHIMQTPKPFVVVKHGFDLLKCLMRHYEKIHWKDAPSAVWREVIGVDETTKRSPSRRNASFT